MKKYLDFIEGLFCDKRLKDIQIPIQTSSRRLLGLMNRNYNIDDVADFVKSVKKNNSGMLLRTDLMAGFPTETYDELYSSVVFATNYFDEIAVYGFELKANTPLFHADLPQHSDSEIKKRKAYAIDAIGKQGLLVHSGGQDVDSLFNNDRLKEFSRS